MPHLVRLQLISFLGLIAFCLPVDAAEPQANTSLELTLPADFYAAAEVETCVYFDNIVLTQELENYQFEVDCALGTTEKNRWTCKPQADQQGEYPLQISVKDSTGKLLEKASTTLHVVAPNPDIQREIRLLIVGDSLTHATLYPNEIARLLSLTPGQKWTMFGTHKPASAAEGVAHEGYGGWTWQRFETLFMPEADPADRKKRSPFVYADENGKPRLDLEQYFQKECGGQKPDYIVFLLGINDCFRGDPANPDPVINEMFEHAENVLKAFRQAAPEAQFGFCLTPPPNDRDSAFDNNYHGRYTRWGWKRIQHQLVQRQLAWAAQQPDQKLSVIPTELSIDPVDGFPVDNAVHPNAKGYQQIGQTIYAWLLAQQ